MYQIKIKKLHGFEDLNLPTKMSESASGYDIYAGVDKEIILAWKDYSKSGKHK